MTGLTFAGRRKFWQLFTKHAMAEPDRWPDAADFEKWVAEVRSLGPAVDQGSVTLIRADHGDPELLTLRAVRAVQSADVILFDHGISPDVLDFARREAKKIALNEDTAASVLNEQLTELVKSGNRVVLLSSSDPANSARA
jgi:uroporphyrin-III C-methyltransferase/precorrin-2 dehydrogenase/sirohydrochlorin ferrochelatase